MHPLIYLDYAATTPVAKTVAEKMLAHLCADAVFANPASRSHMLGWQAEAAVEQARKQVAELIGADTREIVWTSGATEANNLALKGVCEARSRQGAEAGGHIISSATEHKAVLDCLEYLEGLGYRVTYLKPGASGVVTVQMVEQVLCEDTFMISLMHVNNETGALNQISEIAELARARDIVMHVDAAQAVGKVAIDLQSLPVDLLSMCAHKVYGPKGVGALYVRRRPGLTVAAQIHGGGHERGMRSGTLPTHQLVGMGAAFELAGERMARDAAHYAELKQLVLTSLLDLDQVALNGDVAQSVANIVNLSFKGLDGQLLLSALPGLALSSGSACTSATMAPSHVLKAMGVDDELALSSLRLSFGRETTASDVTRALEHIRNAVSKLTSV